MVRFSNLLVVTIAMCLTAGAIPGSAQQAPLAAAKPATATPSWPRVFDRNGTHVVVYQPQLKAGSSTGHWLPTPRSPSPIPDRKLSWA